MRPQRIAYVLKIFPKLSETFIVGELAELRRRGIEVQIFSLLPPREELRHEIIGRAGLDKLTVYGQEKFSTVLKEFKPQLLHAHFATESTEAARELAAEEKVPFTFTAHGYDIHRKPPPDFSERAAAAGAVITVSEANADYIARTFAVPRPHIRVIPCGVDTELFRPARWGEAPDEPGREGGLRGRSPHRVKSSDNENLPLLVCVARHVKVKNLELLLEACAELRRRGLKFRCALVGDGPLRGELETLGARLCLQEIVEMPGAVEQGKVLSWWQRASIGVLTSENEGMPASLMEAAACGVPVVAPAVGGIPELVENGVTGLLAASGDKTGLIAALERLLRDETLREKLGASARRRAEERFSVTRQVDKLLGLWSEILDRPMQTVEASGANNPAATRRGALRGAATKVSVRDPFGAATDSELPTLAAALDPLRVKSEFKRGFPRLTSSGFIVLKSIRVTRYKPGRRCVVEYDVRVEEGGQRRGRLILIGKARARRSGNEGLRLLDAIWNAGFDANSADGISVPEPIGVIPDFRMWFQRKVPGKTAAELLAGPKGVRLARRIAEAIHKLHRANIPAERSHTMADELRILRECLDSVVAEKPQWEQRIQRVWKACERLAASVLPPRTCGIHRDFYPAQVIVDGKRLYLIDFDLYCEGEPGLDVGNFIGHVTEESLRMLGDAGALADRERALEERFVELSGERVRESVRAYTTLTLVRHVYLSTQFPERQPFTEKLLELCERRLG